MEVKEKAAKLWKALHESEKGGFLLFGGAQSIATHREAEMDGEVYREATLLPDNAVEMRYLDARKFMLTDIERIETRQVYYGNKLEPIVYNLRIFWVNHELELGYGMADDLQGKRILWLRFGTERNWFLHESRCLIRNKAQLCKRGKAETFTL